jgi:predicted GNAT family acetyltransferase
MGRYFGIRDAQGQLVAMAGERLTAPGWREISAVCTHPDHVGQGHARALMARVMALHEAEGRTSFLHVQPTNAGAIRLYEALGFVVRAEVPLWRLRNDG